MRTDFKRLVEKRQTFHLQQHNVRNIHVVMAKTDKRRKILTFQLLCIFSIERLEVL